MSIHTPLHIGHIIRNAIVFNSNNWDGTFVNSDSLLHSVENLFTLLRKREIEYVLVGGVALLQYVEGRNTEDIDLIMALSALQKIPEIHIDRQDMDFARGEFEALRIDILLTQNPLFAQVQREYTATHYFAEQAIPTATVEGLLLLKLYDLPSLYRQGNFARVGIYENDIATLLHYYRPDVEALLIELSRHLDDNDMDEIKAIIEEIKQRIKRFQKGAE